jgi:hypothetical protein
MPADQTCVSGSCRAVARAATLEVIEGRGRRAASVGADGRWVRARFAGGLPRRGAVHLPERPEGTDRGVGARTARRAVGGLGGARRVRGTTGPAAARDGRRANRAGPLARAGRCERRPLWRLAAARLDADRPHPASQRWILLGSRRARSDDRHRPVGAADHARDGRVATRSTPLILGHRQRASHCARRLRRRARADRLPKTALRSAAPRRSRRALDNRVVHRARGGRVPGRCRPLLGGRRRAHGLRQPRLAA